jgi:hypothetical protein
VTPGWWFVAAALAVGWALGGGMAARPRGPAGHVSLCLVVRDAADRVEGEVGEVLRLAARLGPLVRDVLVVDAGSQDGTAELLRRLGRRHPSLKVLCWPEDAPPGSGPLEAARAAAEAAWMLVGGNPRALPDSLARALADLPDGPRAGPGR